MSDGTEDWVPFSCSSRSLARAKPGAMEERDDGWLIRPDVRLIVSGDEDVTPLEEPGEEDLELLLSAVPSPRGARGYAELSRFRISRSDFEGKKRTLLGFDVMDKLGFSALTNCRNERLSTGALAERFAGEINELHLLKGVEQADVLVSGADAAIDTHAPFAVVAVERLSAPL